MNENKYLYLFDWELVGGPPKSKRINNNNNKNHYKEVIGICLKMLRSSCLSLLVTVWKDIN